MLLIARLVIHKQDDLPVALEHVPGDVSGHRDSAPRDAGAVHGTLVDVPGHDGIASTVAIRILAYPTRAQDIASADF